MRRHPAPIAAALALGGLALLYATDRPVYLAILQAIHVHPFPRPFLDARFVTAQAECWRRGIDVYAHNSCDPLGRTMDYSPLWLRLPFLARPDGWTPAFGLAIDFLFVLALFRMPWAPAGAFGAVIGVAAALSWATLFATERANTDLLIFSTAVLYAHLLTRPGPARAAGHALVLGAGLLKFYPLAMLALLVREPRRQAWLLAGLCALVLVAFVAAFQAELARIGANMADAFFGDMFGARSLPFGLPLLLAGARIRYPSGLYVGAEALDGATRAIGWVLFGLATTVCAIAAILRARDPRLHVALARLEPASRSLLLVGAVLCVACFFGHQNIGYRAVLLLLVLPGLLALARGAPDARTRWHARATCVLIVAVLWDGVLSRSVAGWVMMELAWWWIVLVLLTMGVAGLGRDLGRVLGLSRGGVRA